MKLSTLVPAVLLSLGAMASLYPSSARSAEGSADHQRWMGSMGASGLRRSLANGADLGDLLNRGISYRAAFVAESIRLRREATGAPLSPPILDSKTNGWIAQAESLIPVSRIADREILFRTTLRSARRFEPNRLDGRADRIDLGLVLGAKNGNRSPGYTGVGLILEHIEADIGFVQGSRDISGIGARGDWGQVLNARWASSVRIEQLWSDGRSEVLRPSSSGPIEVRQDLNFNRIYLDADMIARYTLASGQLRWRTGLRYMRIEYEDQLNNLGEQATETFGPLERLGLLRTGAYYSWRVGTSEKWSPYSELVYDYEFETNMNALIDDRHTLTAKLGVTWSIRNGQRIQLEYQRFQGFNDERVRDALSLVGVFDF